MSSQNPVRLVFLTALVWVACLFLVPLGIQLVVNEVNLATYYSLDPEFGGYFHAMFFGPAAGGALAGFWTARRVKQYADLPSMRVPLMVVVWAVALLLFAILPMITGNLNLRYQETLPPSDIYVGPAVIPPFLQVLSFTVHLLSRFIPASLGGMLFGMEIRRAGLRMRSSKLALIAASWGLGFTVGGVLGDVTGSLIFEFLLGPVVPSWLGGVLILWGVFAISGLIGGALGAWATVRAMRPAASASTGAVQVK